VDGSVTQGKWEKAQDLLGQVQKELGMPDQMRRAILESTHSFMVYMVWTYWNATPFPKGMHLTIDSWRHYHD